MPGSRETAACYRLYAANCLEIAEKTPDPERRVSLFRIAQAWTRLADKMGLKKIRLGMKHLRKTAASQLGQHPQYKF